jgi:hypothetical protein
MRTSATGSGSERRQHARYSFTGTLEAIEPDSETKIQGRTTDLSEGGCYVDTLNSFPAQTRVNVRLTGGNRSFESRATVVYSVVGMGMGLRFEAIDPEQLANLRKWLGELSGESMPASDWDENNASDRVAEDGTLSETVSEYVRKGSGTASANGQVLQPLL